MDATGETVTVVGTGGAETVIDLTEDVVKLIEGSELRIVADATGVR